MDLLSLFVSIARHLPPEARLLYVVVETAIALGLPTVAIGMVLDGHLHLLVGTKAPHVALLGAEVVVLPEEILVVTVELHQAA